MKIITVNLKKYRIMLRLLCIITVFTLVIGICINISSRFIAASSSYYEKVSNLTDRKTIIIDAGHGGEDCGAIGTTGVYEKDLNLSVATILGELLSENGVAVVYTRTADKLLYTDEENIRGIRKISDLKNRCKIGAEYPNSIFVSIHMNSFSSEKYSGLHTYYSESTNDSYKLATAIQSSVKSRLQPNNERVPKVGKGMYLLENLTNTAVLIECGFLTNADECNKLMQKEYQKELSFSIMCGIIDYMNNS